MKAEGKQNLERISRTSRWWEPFEADTDSSSGHFTY